MLAYLPPLFFFAALMGSPVVGFLVFMGLGLAQIWQRWRAPADDVAFVWTREDTLLALCFMSIPLFKAFTVLWSPSPALAWGNVAWHLYFLFWPLVLIGLSRCNTRDVELDGAIAAGLIVSALWGIYEVKIVGAEDLHGLGNVGITAQIAMTMGIWNLLALTRPTNTSRSKHVFLFLGLLGTLIILVLSTRRIELIGFIVLSGCVLAHRYRRHFTPWRTVGFIFLFLVFLLLMIALRWEKFLLGFAQVEAYFSPNINRLELTTQTSMGVRLEMWRTGWAAFCDHAMLGLSASARPSGLQMYGAPPAELYGHRHFHSHLLQVLVEGGLLGLTVLLATLAYSTRVLIIKPFREAPENALLAAALLGSYTIEGLTSAALVYDKPNALLVVTSAWIWLKLRSGRKKYIS